MFSMFKNLAVVLLALCLNSGYVYGTSTFTVSWIFRGQAVQNNTVLQFNMMDTLNLVCKSELSMPTPFPGYIRPMFVITKGPSPPTNIAFMSINSGDYTLYIDNPGTLIYSDYDGLQTGFENFLVTLGHQTIYTVYYYRYINIGILRPEDSGTYHCGATYYVDYIMLDIGPGSDLNYPTSGGLNIVVNTKPSQAHSSRAKSANLFSYAAVIMATSKVLF